MHQGRRTDCFRHIAVGTAYDAVVENLILLLYFRFSLHVVFTVHRLRRSLCIALCRIGEGFGFEIGKMGGAFFHHFHGIVFGFVDAVTIHGFSCFFPVFIGIDFVIIFI